MIRPAQKQNKQPGTEGKMTPLPEYLPKKPGLKLEGKVAVITGGDSGIGRAVAIAFAQEGADILISYFDEHEDVKRNCPEPLRNLVEGHRISGDISTREAL